MKIPKYIEKLLDSRAYHYEEAMEADVIICEWLDKHGVVVEEYDIATGCESIVNPRASVRRIKEAIKIK